MWWFRVEDLCREFDIKTTEASVEGILLINLDSKYKGAKTCNSCMCMLPTSSRFDAKRRSKCLLWLTVTFVSNQRVSEKKKKKKKDSLFYLCGDSNARCSDFEDFIQGVDKNQDRNVVDFTPIGYGEIFCNVLIYANWCMLNGRSNPTQNNCTIMSSQGSSVVDYWGAPQI